MAKILILVNYLVKKHYKTLNIVINILKKMNMISLKITAKLLLYQKIKKLNLKQSVYFKFLTLLVIILIINGL